MDYKKEQTEKVMENLNEKKRREDDYSIEKCIDNLEAMEELTDEEKADALVVFESKVNRQIFIKTKNSNVQLIWLKKKITP